VSAYAGIVALLDRDGYWPGEPGRGNARCPSHEDRQPSLGVGVRRDGDGALIYCQAGCATADVLAALDLPVAALFDSWWAPRRSSPSRQGWASWAS
jgi:hypothetical protein